MTWWFLTYEEALEHVDGDNALAFFGYSLTVLDNRIRNASIYVVTSDEKHITGPDYFGVSIHQMSDEFYNDNAVRRDFTPENVPAEAKALKYVCLEMPKSDILKALTFGIEVAFGIFVQNSFVWSTT